MVQSTIQGKFCQKNWKTLFSTQNKFHKIFNRNTVRINYNCIRNNKTINPHNHKITNFKTIAKDKICNCEDKAKC